MAQLNLLLTKLTIFTSVLLATIGATNVMAQEAAAKLTPYEVGQKCLKCHEEDVKNYQFSAHAKSAQFLKGKEAATCDTCHGDGAKHSRSSKPADILNPPSLPSAQASEMCMNCHARDETHVAFRGSAHDRKDMSCVSCHKEHHAAGKGRLQSRTGLRPTPATLAKVTGKLLKMPDQELCLSCHKDKRKSTLQRSTHLFATEHGDSKITCISCHNPHGGEGKPMLWASSTTQLCYSCHAEKRGPFLWEHTPARENCNSCHVPHGSNNLNLLKARTTVLCQSCHMHMMWRHQTVAGFDMFTFNKGCTNCHSQIHGSNHPSGKAFTH